MLKLIDVKETDRTLLWNIFQKFLYEMTNYYEDEMDSEGNYHYAYFEQYFAEPHRKALLLYDDEALIGFVMLNNHSYINETPDTVLAEFTIFPMYRKRHFGRLAAEMLFSEYKGVWEIKYNTKNDGAKALWQKVTERFCPVAHRCGEDEIVLSFCTKER